MMATFSGPRLGAKQHFIRVLEEEGQLDRELEYLPDDIEIEERKARKQGITRPELAVVLSYAKIDVYDALNASGETMEDFLKTHPMRYFPEVLRRRYVDFIPVHRLSPQILATLIANDIVNRMGPAFVKRVQLDTGADVEYVPADFRRFGPILRRIEPRVMATAAAPPDGDGWMSLSLHAGASVDELHRAAADAGRVLIVEVSQNYPTTMGVAPDHMHRIHARRTLCAPAPV